MKKMAISRKQAMSDFNYLSENLSDYAVNTEWLVNDVFYGIVWRDENITIIDIIIGAIRDIILYNTEQGEEEDVEFLENDKRALRIKKRYNIEVE